MAASPDRDEVKVTRPRPEPRYEWFTTCPQEWFIVVVRGEDLHRIIHSVEGWDVDENFTFQEDPNRLRTYSPLRALIGREFVGIPGLQGMLVYKFAWNKFWRATEKDVASGKMVETPEYIAQIHEPENVYITPFEAQYPLKYGGIEVIASDRTNDKEEVRIPITLVITVRVRMRRPRIALMTNTDWFGQVLTPNIQKAAKDFAGNKHYDQIIGQALSRESKEFSNQFMRSGNALHEFSDTILNNAGVEIIDIGITDIQPNKEFEEALLAQAAAERAARAIKAKAEGEKEARILAGQAEKEYQKLVGEGNAARILAEAEADMERIKKTILTATGQPGSLATTLEKFRQLRGSGIITYVEGNSEKSNVSILVGSDGRPIASP